MTAFALFDTAIGTCALLWRGSAIVGAALPEASDARMDASLCRRFPDAEEQLPPLFVTQAIEAVRRLLAGGREDLSSVRVNLDGLADFERKILDNARAIPVGETRTYGEIAAMIGAPGAARAVGAALGRNPIPIIIPCHRVLAADGKSGGFSAPGGANTKLKMLEIERARRGSDPGLFGALPWQVRPAD